MTEALKAETTEVFILYCKDTLLKQLFGVSEEEFCRDVLELADILTCCGGLKCSIDVYEGEDPQNWNLWTKNKISQSEHVLMVCSPQLKECLSFNGDRDVYMYKGMFFSQSVVNTVKAPKFIPVFLNGFEPPSNLKLWVPLELHGSRQYQLRDLRELYQQINPEVYPEEERRPRMAQCLQERRYKNLAELVRRLRKERDVVPPAGPDHPIPIPSPGNSPVLPKRGQPFREGSQQAEFIPDTTLQRISERLTTVHDWMHFGVKLGVEYSTCSRLKLRHGEDCASAVLDVIATWQRLKGQAATQRVLKRALVDVGFGRLAEECFSHIKL